MIALPLCFGIAMASEFPPMAAIISAIIGGLVVSRIKGAAIFSNFMALKRGLSELPAGERINVDLSYASLVDHTIMEFSHRYGREYSAQGGRCEVRGLKRYEPYSLHPLAARRRKALT